MSVVDKMIAAVTPMASDEKRAEAHATARGMSGGDDWLSMLLDHHEQIELAFDVVRSAGDAASRRAAQEELAALLTAHSVAEENVLYPALAQIDEKAHATMAYTEQSAAKLQLGLLEYLAPMSQDYLDKLGHIRGAVLQHIYQEESSWFLELRQKAPNQGRLTERYQIEFDRYLNGAIEQPLSRDAPPLSGVQPAL